MPRLKSSALALILSLSTWSLAQQSSNEAMQPITSYKVGKGVSAPRVILSPNPRYTDEARNSKVEGSVVLWLIVGVDGLAHDIKVARGLGYGLDREAVDAVAQWKFQPGRKNGSPVPVRINVDVRYRLK